MYKKIVFVAHLICLVVHSNAADAKRSTQATITGSIALSGIFPYYNGSRYVTSRLKGVQLHRSLRPGDILVKVCVTTDQKSSSSTSSENSSESTTSQFPCFLPAFLFEGKKEGEILELVVKTSQSLVTAKLLCQNNQNCCAAGKNFEDSLKTILSNCPDYDSDDEKLLVSCGIINKPVQLKK